MLVKSDNYKNTPYMDKKTNGQDGEYQAYLQSVTHLTDACDGCPGRCCTSRFWEAVELTEREQSIPLFADVMIEAEDGRKLLPFVEDRCVFLSAAGKCNIYENRPAACRSYVCHWGDRRSVDIILNYQAHRKHLSKKGLMPRSWDYAKAFFYVVGDLESSVYHLRELRGRQDVEIGRYYPSTDTCKVVGKFDAKGRFTKI